MQIGSAHRVPRISTGARFGGCRHDFLISRVNAVVATAAAKCKHITTRTACSAASARPLRLGVEESTKTALFRGEKVRR